jgi:hypothetical protein
MLTIAIEQTDDINPTLIDRNLRDAASNALDAVALSCVLALEAETLTAFDRPVPWTQRAFGCFRAREFGGGIDSLVFIRRDQSDWLYERQVSGGPLEAGDPGTSSKLGLAVPGPEAKLTAYGGLPRGAIREAMASGRAWFKDRGDGEVSVLVRDLDGNASLLATFVEKVDYEPSFPFYDVVYNTFSAEMARHFSVSSNNNT